MNQPGWSGPEVAGIEVERCEVLLEVDVKPLAPGCLCMRRSVADKRGANPLPLMLTSDLGIQEEGMIASVPCDVDKADKAAVGLQAGGNPAKAVSPHLIPPASRRLAAMRSDKQDHLCVRDWCAPAVPNWLRHTADHLASVLQTSTSWAASWAGPVYGGQLWAVRCPVQTPHCRADHGNMRADSRSFTSEGLSLRVSWLALDEVR